MDEYARHLRIWKSLHGLLSRWLCRKFNLIHEDLHVDGPMLLIPNHASAWDPLLVATSLRDKHAYFVASEHLFRLGFLTKLLNYLGLSGTAPDPSPAPPASGGYPVPTRTLKKGMQGEDVKWVQGNSCSPP